MKSRLYRDVYGTEVIDVRSNPKLSFDTYARGSTEETHSGARHFNRESVFAESKAQAEIKAAANFKARFGYYPEVVETAEEKP